jgi:methionyl-tRNA formyltransferase
VPEDGKIDWRLDAERIDALIRSCGRPYAGAFTLFNNNELRIWAAHPDPGPTSYFATPGQLFTLPGEDRPAVSTGTSRLFLDEVTYPEGDSAVEHLLRSNLARFG